MKRLIQLFILLLVTQCAHAALPRGFVYLSDVDPSIQQDIRYAGFHNFMGRPILGYNKPVCILTKKAAYALKRVQTTLRKQGYSLKVYDCYRPKSATNAMYAWSNNSDCQQMKAEFFPREKKSELFNNGYIALYSGHNRGSTIDLTIVYPKNNAHTEYQPGQPLTPCYSSDRFDDNSIDMGTGFDCLDKAANVHHKPISPAAYKNRLMLQSVMKRYGFVPYVNEWWHFSLRREPYRKQRFNFPVE